MLLRTRFIWIGCLLGVLGLSVACTVGASPREQALEATVAALQNQVATSSAPVVLATATPMPALQNPVATSLAPVIPATLTPVPTPDWRKQLIGIIYPPMPEGWESTGGALTFSDCVTIPCPADEQTYAVAQWRQINPAGGTAEELLLFEKQVGRESNGKAIWTVLDILVGSEIGGSNWLWQGCRVGDSEATDNEIVALYGIVLDPSTPAWRANHLTGRFEPISTDGITCVDENAVN